MLRNDEIDSLGKGSQNDSTDSEFSGTIVNEHELLADETGEVKDKIIQKFEQYKKDILKLIDAGVSPSNYEKYNGYLAAIDVAVKAIEEVWAAGRRDE